MADVAAPTTIESVLQESRLFPPPAQFAAQARVKSMAEYESLYNRSLETPEAFWREMAEENLQWMEPFTAVQQGGFPDANWFAGGTLNLAVNCVDRHLTTWRRNKAAIIWEGEPGDTRVLTYQDLHRLVCQCANALTGLGVKAGDRVIIYMPMVPEAAVAMLACARIGATHSVVFGGFSAEALVDRIEDSGATMVITADGGYRRGGVVPLKDNVDAALKKTSTVEHVLVLRRTCQDIGMAEGRDLWWHDTVDQAPWTHQAQPFGSEHPLFILYTSGTT
ncbi:MAG TPA: AMP-binding protein, partial [bacterium]|nr:AMP-binding protein [bacterium]